jgi:hypothetical protein
MMFPQGKRGGFKVRGRRGGGKSETKGRSDKSLSALSDERAGQGIDKGDELKLRYDVPRGARGEKQE